MSVDDPIAASRTDLQHAYEELLAGLTRWRTDLSLHNDRSTLWYGIMDKAVRFCEMIIAGVATSLSRKEEAKRRTMGGWVKVLETGDFQHPLAPMARESAFLDLIREIKRQRNDFIHRLQPNFGPPSAVKFLDLSEKLIHSAVVVQLASSAVNKPPKALSS